MFDCGKPKLPDGVTEDETRPRPACNEGLCCGAAKKADSDDDTRIEVCWDFDATRLNYLPKPPPGSTTLPEEEEWLFLCIWAGSCNRLAATTILTIYTVSVFYIMG